MSPNPCCGLSLRQGTVMVALIDIAGAVVGVFVSVLSLIFLLFFENDVRIFLEREDWNGKDGREFLALFDQMGVVIISALALILLTFLFHLALATFLFKGARERNSANCQLWWKIKVILFIVGVFFASGIILVSRNPGQLAVSSVLGFVYQAYALWVVQAFTDEIKFGHKLSSINEEAQSGLYS